MKEFPAVKAFIASHDMKTLPCGRYDIDENNYVKISEMDTKQPGELLFEKHDKYIDVHYLIDGDERMLIGEGKAALAKEYNEAKDCAFYTCESYRKVIIKEGESLVCDTDCLHVGAFSVNEPRKIKKAVFKVRK